MNEENIEHKVDVTFTTGEATNEYLKNKIIPIIYMKEEFDIKDANRTYYYNIFGKMEPDYESMAAYLLDVGILFVSSAISKQQNGKDCLALYVLINDYFVPASDGEEVCGMFTTSRVTEVGNNYFKTQNSVYSYKFL